MREPRRVSLKMIADDCGVSVATVSYALKKHAKISAETRSRISKRARELGYVPDPVVASLTFKRSLKANAPLNTSMAVLFPHSKDSRQTQLFKVHYGHFVERMKALGCSVTDFYIDADRYRPERLAQILRTRGIKGLLLGWGSWPEKMLNFPWNEFSVISTERTHLRPDFDLVAMNHFHAMEAAIEHLQPGPKARIGLIMHADCPASTETLLLGAYNAHIYERGQRSARLDICRLEPQGPSAQLREWYQKNSPNLVLCHRLIPYRYFLEAGIEAPTMVRIAVLEIDETDSDKKYTGNYTKAELGFAMANILARKVKSEVAQDEKIVPKITLVNGIWEEGETT